MLRGFLGMAAAICTLTLVGGSLGSAAAGKMAAPPTTAQVEQALGTVQGAVFPVGFYNAANAAHFTGTQLCSGPHRWETGHPCGERDLLSRGPYLLAPSFRHLPGAGGGFWPWLLPNLGTAAPETGAGPNSDHPRRGETLAWSGTGTDVPAYFHHETGEPYHGVAGTGGQRPV